MMPGSWPGWTPSAAVPNPCCAHVAVTAPVRTWAPVPARIAVAGGGAAGAVATPRTPDIAKVTAMFRRESAGPATTEDYRRATEHNRSVQALQREEYGNAAARGFGASGWGVPVSYQYQPG